MSKIQSLLNGESHDLESAKLIIDDYIKNDSDVLCDDVLFADINIDPEIFEYYTKTIGLNEEFSNYDDLSDYFDVRNAENALKNFETLAKYAPSAFNKRILLRRTPEGDLYFHYLAELPRNNNNKKVSALIISHTPTKVLEEILMCSPCLNSTFEMIHHELETRSGPVSPQEFKEKLVNMTRKQFNLADEGDVFNKVYRFVDDLQWGVGNPADVNARITTLEEETRKIKASITAAEEETRKLKESIYSLIKSKEIHSRIHEREIFDQLYNLDNATPSHHKESFSEDEATRDVKEEILRRIREQEELATEGITDRDITQATPSAKGQLKNLIFQTDDPMIQEFFLTMGKTRY